MKQLLFLLLFPCFAMAQYTGNAGQKITLGEQTTADGLVFRGVAADTTLTVKSDTAAYFVLDTVNLNLYTYKASASGRKWRQLGADTAAIAYVNTYGTQTVNGAKTFTSELTATRFNPTANTATGTGMFLPAANTLGFSTNGTEKVRITSGGNLGLGTNSVTEKLTVNGKGLFENNSNAAQQLIIKNTTAGSISEAYLYLISDIAAGSTTLGKFSSTTTPVKIIGASNAYWYNGTAGDIAIINDFGSGAIKMSAGGSSTAQLTLNASGNVGIGTSIPDRPLDIYSASTVGIARIRANNVNGSAITVQNDENSQSISMYAAGSSAFSIGGWAGNAVLESVTGVVNSAYNGNHIFQTGSGRTERMRITSGGEVWIDYTTDQGAYKLQVKDSVYVGGNVSASAYTTRSDYDLKDEIQNISYGINEVMQMQPVKYTYKSNGSTQLGFIAQDLGVITPEVVSFEDKMSVYYNALIPILTKAIQEQQALIKALEQRIINLENK